jgi:hypothetical protein
VHLRHSRSLKLIDQPVPDDALPIIPLRINAEPEEYDDGENPDQTSGEGRNTYAYMILQIVPQNSIRQLRYEYTGGLGG